MPEVVIASAVRTAIGTARKGSLAETPAEELARVVLEESIRRADLNPHLIDDVIFAESLYGGGVLARHAAVEAGLLHVAGAAVNRHCAGGLTSVAFAAGSIAAGMDRAIVAGGVQSSSLSPKLQRRVPGGGPELVDWFPPSHPDQPEAPNMDMSISVGWNTAQEVGISREEQDAWALRSHERAIAAIHAGRFVDEIVAVNALQKDGSRMEFSVDEHPRRGTSMDALSALPVLHPEIEGFSVTAGNASGINDAAAALVLTSDELADREGLPVLATIRGWASAGIDPRLMGLASVSSISRLLDRTGVAISEIALWEINEAFASVPIAACRRLGIDDSIVNINGSGCSLGHPIAASGARMLITLINDLHRRGGGIGVAAMCAGGGQGGAVMVEV